MAKGWYILHVYSGHEGKVERAIRFMLEGGDLPSDIVLDVKVPVEDVVVTRKDGKRHTVPRKFLPGYIMIELNLPDIGWKTVCTNIRRIQGVTGFVGASGNIKPRPISNDEAIALLQKSGEIKGDKSARMRQNFVIGEQVKITEGLFVSFSGAIEEINSEKSRLRVMVGIFGRATPVEVDFNQVEKI